jgi:hypothetical protein
MQAQIKRAVLIAIVFTAVLGGFAGQASAAGVTVDVVAATQFDSGLFIALVTAHGANDLIDAQLVVNSTPIVPASVTEYSFDGPRNTTVTLFKIVTYTNVVSPGDTLTAIVTDVSAASGTRTVACGRGVPGLHITSICK